MWEDLTGIDFTKSVISEYGKNMSLELYAYFLDPPLDILMIFDV